MGPETAEPIQEEEQEKTLQIKTAHINESQKKTLQYSQNQTNPYSHFRTKVQKQQEKKKNIIA